MVRPTNIIDAMRDIIELFEPKCEDKATLSKLIELINDRKRRSEGHALFREIRSKTLLASKRGDKLAECQYLFEEICAKTLYNLTYPNNGFDPDSPFWVLPTAIEFGARIGISPGDVSPLLGAPQASR